MIALVSVLGLMLGTTILVLVLSMMNGFERELRERVLGVLPHAVIRPEGRNLDLPALMQLAEQHPEVAAAAPLVSGRGLVFAGQRVFGAAISGVDPALERQVSILPDLMQTGDFSALNQPWSLLLGLRLADELGVQPGDRVTLAVPEALVTLAGLKPRSRRFTVGGIFQVGSDTDLNQVIMHSRDAKKLLLRSGESGLRLKLHDLFLAHQVLADLAAEVGMEKVSGYTWMQLFGSLYDAIGLQKSTMWLLLLLIVLVAVFNLVSTLVLMVAERRGEIAILRSMGARMRALVLSFVFYGLLTWAAGTLFGLLLGALLASLISPGYELLVGLTGWRPMNEYFINYLPSQLLLQDLLQISAASLVLCLLATVYPAIRAALSHPAEVLRYE